MSELLKINNLKAYYYTLRGIVKAVDDVSLVLNRNEFMSIVGESGSGKSTLAHAIPKLLRPPGKIVNGEIILENENLTRMNDEEIRKVRGRKIGFVFQDPFTSLDPLVRIGDQITEVFIEHGIADKDNAKEKAMKLLEEVGIPSDRYKYYPHQLSGGQRQRVAIARAMILKPKFVVADEPVSMIDVSLRISILELLTSFKKEYKTSMLLITHDLGIASIIAERIAVMYLGKIVEIGPTKEVINKPAHPYTIGLLSSIPSPRKHIKKLTIIGEIADPKNPPSGCRFHPRCPFATDKCKKEEPQLTRINENHFSACHYSLEIMQQYSTS